MAIQIKAMDKPESCAVCPFVRIVGGFAIPCIFSPKFFSVEFNAAYNGKTAPPEWCPIEQKDDETKEGKK